MEGALWKSDVANCLYKILEEEFRHAGKKSWLHSLCLIGTFKRDDDSYIPTLDSRARGLKPFPPDEAFSGFIIVIEDTFIMCTESSGDGMIKWLEKLYLDQEAEKVDVKILFMRHNLPHRQLYGWSTAYYSAVRSTTSEVVENESPLDCIVRQILMILIYCINSPALKSLAEALNELPYIFPSLVPSYYTLKEVITSGYGTDLTHFVRNFIHENEETPFDSETVIPVPKLPDIQFD